MQVILLVTQRPVDEEVHEYENESRRRNPTIELDTMKRRGRPHIYGAVPGRGSEMFESSPNRVEAPRRGFGGTSREHPFPSASTSYTGVFLDPVDS